MAADVPTADADLGVIADLYRRGRYLDAYAQAKGAGPLEHWRGAERRLWAGRLAGNLGALRRAQAIFLVAWREAPGDPAIAPYAARTLLDRRGPYDAWQFLTRTQDLSFRSADQEADWYSVHARVLASCRDFERAQHWIERARDVGARDSWARFEQASLLLRQDRREEARDALRQLLVDDPWYRPAVHGLADVLLELGEKQEAVSLLRSAVPIIQSGFLAMRLARVLFDDGHLAEARSLAEHATRCLPLAERAVAAGIAGLRAEIAYQEGSVEEAITHARGAGGAYYENLATALEAESAEGRAFALDVPHVAQHHNTCGPATLAMLGPYWSKPVDHLQVAQAICYDGTPDHVERRWAESNGWCVREFSASWEAAVSLIQREIPFALTTVEATSAHLQAIIGVDTRLGTLLVRDPSQSNLSAAIARPFLERNASTGPRGMAMVPVERGALLDGLELPDEDLFDAVYRMKGALEVHDRPAAREALERLEARHPDHPLAIRARWTLCLYDADTIGSLDCIERLLVQFPEDEGLQLRRATAFVDLGRNRDRHELLRERVAARYSDPIFRQQLAEDLRLHASGWSEAEYWLRSAIRSRPTEAIHYKSLADLRASQQRNVEALLLLRLAACLDDTNEWYSEAYFLHARVLGHTDEALHFLRLRWERLGELSGGPVRTLFQALSQLGRAHDALELLDEALRKRPEDAALALFAASELASRGDLDRADRLLGEAEGRSKRSEWLRVSAELREQRGEPHEALAAWREVCSIEPLSVDAHRRVAGLLRSTEGKRAAVRYLDQVCDAAPEHRGLGSLRIEWTRVVDEAAAESLIRALVERSPNDAWAHRELALCLLEQGRGEEGSQAAREGLRLDPRSSTSHVIAAYLYEAIGDRALADEHYRECIRLDVDRGDAIRRLVDGCEDVEARREALRFVESELHRQVVFGDGLSAYREAASASLAPDEVLELLRTGLETRQDLWCAWSQFAKQLSAMGRLDEALEHARQATERFPLVAELWADLADVEAALGHPDRQIAALERACEISPGWDWASRELGVALQAAGELVRAREVLEIAVRRSPRDPHSRGCLADLYRAEGNHTRALEELEESLRLYPDYGWAWNAHREWTAEDPERGPALARRITREQAGDPNAWLALADALDEESRDERLEAIEKAIALDPERVAAWDRKMTLLAEAGRHDEALAVLEAAATPSGTPPALRARAAWVVAHGGDMGTAVDRMREVLRAAPGLYWGWKQLEDWCEALEDKEGAVEAAEVMVQIAPGVGEAWNYLGSAQLIAGNGEAARSALERGFGLAPDNGWSGMNLFDLQLEAGDVEAAKTTCELLEARVGGEFVDARWIQFECETGALDAALARFEALCGVESEETWPLESAATALENAGQFDRVSRVLSQRIGLEPPVARVVALWASRHVAKEMFRQCQERIAELPPGPLASEAMHAYLSALGDRSDTKLAGRLRSFLRRHESVSKQSTRLWGIAGYALTSSSAFRDGARWLEDWEARADVESWMLQNLALSLWETDRMDEALAVSQAAAARFDASETHTHRLWLAAAALVEGRDADVDRFMAGVAETDVGSHFGALRDMVLAIRRLESGESDAAAVREARRTVDSLAESAKQRTYLRRLFRHAVRRIARQGGLATWPWALWQLARS